ncbi:MAG TPA: hypothetical protein VMT17_13625 [Anaeromyxobacteraceae bacterium]|nr:hypothetical protein [Anaeromyxobacteraceae bacterium]
MTRAIRTWTLAAAVAAVPLAAQAQSGAKGLGDWSVVGAEIDTGKPFEDVRFGWPDVDFGYTFNVSRSMDMGIRFGLLYGVEGTTYTSFGIDLYTPLRFALAETSDLKILFHVDPGLKLYTSGYGHSSTCYAGNQPYACTVTGGPAQFGFMFPVGIVAGGSVAPGLEVGAGLDLNMTLFVTSPVNFVVEPMVGPYLEYHVPSSGLAIGINTRFGVAIPTAAGYGSAFAFLFQGFVGYHLF